MIRLASVLGAIGAAGFLAYGVVVALPTGPARLVKDINQSPTMEAGGFPDAFVELGAMTLFTATTLEAGLELWRTDGTGAGTFFVKDIRPGSSDGLFAFSALGTLGNRVFFKADDGVHGPELWTSGGTADGSLIVKDIHPTSASSGGVERILTEVGGALLFTASEGLHGFELWRTDGTAQGTLLVKDIRPGSAQSVPGGGRSWAFSPVEIGGVLYFQAFDGIHGLEVWKSDGTEEGTVMIQDIASGPASSGAVFFMNETITGARLLFRADDGVSGNELWGGRAAILANDPRRAVDDLRTELRRVRLPIGLERVLSRALDRTSSILADPGDSPGAILELEHFARQVDLLSPTLISDNDRASLLDFATEIVALLST